MDTEIVRETAHLLEYTSGDLYYMPPKLKNFASSISHAWQGGRAGHYASELEQMGKLLQHQVIELQRLAEVVRKEVDQWEDADSNGASSWKGIGLATMSLGFAVKEINNGAMNINQAYLGKQGVQEKEKKFNWFKWSGKTYSTAMLGIGTMQALSYSKIDGVGKFINRAIQKDHGGWVDKMNGLGHFVKKNSILKTKQFKYFGAAVGIGVGVAQDRMEGDSWFKAIGSEALEFGLKKGITKLATKGLSYLIPGAGQALLVYEGVLLAGRLIAGAAALTGNAEVATQISNTIDVIDINTYTEKLTDGIMDMVENKQHKGGGS
jgi:uncharacterized protein YukE